MTDTKDITKYDKELTNIFEGIISSVNHQVPDATTINAALLQMRGLILEVESKGKLKAWDDIDWFITIAMHRANEERAKISNEIS